MQTHQCVWVCVWRWRLGVLGACVFSGFFEAWGRPSRAGSETWVRQRHALFSPRGNSHILMRNQRAHVLDMSPCLQIIKLYLHIWTLSNDLHTVKPAQCTAVQSMTYLLNDLPTQKPMTYLEQTQTCLDYGSKVNPISRNESNLLSLLLYCQRCI